MALCTVNLFTQHHMSSHVRVTACIAKARESDFFNQRTFMPIPTPHLALIKPIQSDFLFGSTTNPYLVLPAVPWKRVTWIMLNYYPE